MILIRLNNMMKKKLLPVENLPLEELNPEKYTFSIFSKNIQGISKNRLIAFKLEIY